MENKQTSNNFLVANNIRSAYNIGSLFRICSSLNFNLILQGISPYPKLKKDSRLPYIYEKTHEKIKKTSLGTISKVCFYYFKEEFEVVDFLNSKNVHIYTLENNVKKSFNLFNLKKEYIKEPYALILGNEVQGVSSYFINNSSKIIYIPTFGHKASLNVSVSAGIAGYCLKKLSLS